MSIRVAGSLLAVALAVAPGASRAGPAVIVDPMTGTQFAERPTIGGIPFQCLGVGSRKMIGFKVYSLTFCRDEASAQAALRQGVGAHAGKSGDDLAKALKNDNAFFSGLARAPGEKMAVIRFARDISRNQLAKALKGPLQKSLQPADLERVSRVIDLDVKKGDVAILRTDGAKFVFQLGSQKHVLPDANAINTELWNVMLGSDGSAKKLKESIAARAAAMPPPTSVAGGGGGAPVAAAP